MVTAGFAQFIPAGFTTTDWWPVLRTNHLAAPSDLLRLFQEPIGASDDKFLAETARHYRPLATASYAIDYLVWGLDRPIGFQVTSFLIHVGVTLGVYGLARTLGLARWAAVLGAAVFTLHPAAVSTVPGIARRHDTLSALFLMPSLILLLRGRMVGAAVLYACSILSKETSLAALPMVPALLAIRGRPVRWTLVLVLPAAFGIGIRLLALGDLGGYGTASMPSVDAFPMYRDKFMRYVEHFLSPGPHFPTLLDAGRSLTILGGLVIVCALGMPRREGSVALFGMAWVLLFGLFYAFLKVYAGAWYLYIPMIGAGLTVAALASGGVQMLPQGRGRLPSALAAVACILILRTSPLLMPYPEWRSVGALSAAYLARMDTCTEDGRVPLVPEEKGPMSSVVDATGLLDYSVWGYVAIRYPTGRPCNQAR